MSNQCTKYQWLVVAEASAVLQRLPLLVVARRRFLGSSITGQDSAQEPRKMHRLC